MEKQQYLTIIDEIQIHNGKRNVLHYDCICICGNKKLVRKVDFLRNMVVSCGCLTGKLIRSRLLKEIETGSRFGFLVVLNRTEKRTSEGYKYLCLCDCGKQIEVYYNRLKRGETKSCGCSSSKLNSLNNGGNGVAYSYLPVKLAIRQCEKYQIFVKKCLERADGKSELSGKSGERLHVHHLNSVSYLIKKNELTLDSYLNCDELFSLDNAVVLTETEHRNFHKACKKSTTADMWISYKQNELNLVS